MALAVSANGMRGDREVTTRKEHSFLWGHGPCFIKSNDIFAKLPFVNSCNQGKVIFSERQGTWEKQTQVRQNQRGVGCGCNTEMSNSMALVANRSRLISFIRHEPGLDFASFHHSCMLPATRSTREFGYCLHMSCFRIRETRGGSSGGVNDGHGHTLVYKHIIKHSIEVY